MLAAFVVNTLLDTVDANPGDGLALDADGNTSLRAAIIEANALAGADTIALSAGLYQFTRPGDEGGENFSVAGDLDITSQITITGAGTGQTTIDANQLERIFEVYGGASLSLSGLTLTGGRADHGGAILNGGALTLTNVKLTGNQATVNGGAISNRALAGTNFVATVIGTNAEFIGNSAPSVSVTTGSVGLGGALHATSGRVTLNNSLFHQNTAGTEGGAINSSVATVTLNNNTFTENSSGQGGAIRFLSGTATINDTTFIGNRAANSGGAIRSGGATLTINRGDFEDNRTTQMLDWNSSLHGGAISIVSGGTTTIDGTEFRNNASWVGGAIYAASAGVTVRNSLFEGNTARPDSSSGRGGAFYAHTNASVFVINSTLVGNSSHAGGALMSLGATARWVNNTVTGNTTTMIGDFDALNPGAVDGGILWNSIVAGNVGDNNVGTVTSQGGNLIGHTLYFVAQPTDLVGTPATGAIDPHLLPLAENGGPTRTMALAAASPARDRGLYIAPAPTTDARGVSRSGTTLDAGAYEYQNQAPTAYVFTGGVTKHDQPLTGQLQGFDPDGDTLTFTAPYGPSIGTMVIQPNGQFTYTPPANIPGGGRVLFDFRVTDGHGGTSAIVRSEITLLPNFAPTSTKLEAVGAEDEVFTGQLLATDPDGNSLTFEVAAPSGGTVNALPDGQFTFTPNANFAGTAAFWSRARDQYGAYSAWVLNTIAFAPVNDPPIVNDQTFVIDEGAINSTLVGYVQAYDLEWNYPLTGELVSGLEDGALFFNPFSGAIVVVHPELLDYETQPTRSFVVRILDSEGLSTTATITVQLRDIQLPASENSYPFAWENSPAGTSLGYIFLKSIPEPGQILQYEIVGDTSGGKFLINSATGEVTLAPGAAINYEEASIYSLTIRVSDVANPALFHETVHTVSIGNRNDAPVIASDSFSVAENTANGTALGTVIATDEDANQTLTYSISGASVAGAFAINGSTGEITVADASLLNFESVQTVILTISVSDNGNPVPVLTTTREIAIHVTDVNEAPVIADQSFTVAENSLNTNRVGFATGSDVDAGQSLTYSIASSSLPGAFVINPVTGEVTVADGSLLDFEAVTSATLVITATDNGNPALSANATVTVAITDVNERPIIVDQNFTVAENAADGTFVGTVIAGDVDAGQSLTYLITHSVPISGAFAIDAVTGQITVANGSLLNFEGLSAIALTLTVTDNGNPQLSHSAVVVVTLTDVNEAPVITDKSFTVVENSASGTIVGSIIAFDVDAGQSLAYSITGSTLAGAFAIDATSGQITVANAALLNFEAVSSVTLTVTVTDSGNPALSSSALVTISLTNVNEAPTITNQSFSVAENSASGTIVGDVAASDVDAGQSLSYSIASGNTGEAFAINATTGRITVANATALDFETTPSFALTVRVTDNGNPALSSTATVTINLSDVIEAIIVGLDVVPGDATNTIKLNGKFDVVILSTATFDARTVNVSTIRFGKNGTEDSITRDKKGNRIFSYRDVNGDGRLDLVVNITNSLTGLGLTDTLAKFSGLTNSGLQVLGSSAVRVRR